MKHIIALMSLFMAASSYAEYSPACGKEYGKISRQSEPRQVISEQEFQHGEDLELLNKIERKALELYKEGMSGLDEETTFSIQLAKYVDKKNNRKVNGYRVRIDELGADESQISYYLTTSGKLLKSYWDNQSPVHTWICESFDTDHVKFIKELAREFGEYFHYQDEELGKHIKEISFKDLPAKIRKFAETQANQRTEELRAYNPYDENWDYARPADEQFAIIKDGVIIGYVVSIWDSIDHPLWDGSGVYFYIRAETLEVITDMEWTG